MGEQEAGGTAALSEQGELPRHQESCAAPTLLSSRSLFLAAETSSCSAASCFSFSSNWRFRTVTGSPFCVACEREAAHQ